MRSNRTARLESRFGNFDRVCHSEDYPSRADVGRVLLTWLPRDGRLFNIACSEGTPGRAGGVPILLLDLRKHAYHIDFGANAGAYIAAFMRNTDWAAAQGRYEDATKVAPPRPLAQKELAGTPAVSPAARCGASRRAPARQDTSNVPHVGAFAI